MRKIIVLSFVSLDGVMQAPGDSTEDIEGDFKYGGWTFPFFDEISGKMMGEQMTPPFDLLLGRKTYDLFAGYWPKQKHAPAEEFNAAIKYVVSRNTELELPWDKSELITGDVVEKLKNLKQAEGPMLQVHGSGDFVQTLLKNDLVDELWLKTFPVTLGAGKRLFGEGTQPAAFELIDTKTTPSGVVFANYGRGGEVKTGNFGEE